MGKLSQRLLAGGLSLVLVAGLSPAVAFASTDYVAADADVSAGTALTVQADKSIYDARIILATNTHIYDGKEFAPKPIVQYFGKALTEGVDYTLKYQFYNDDERDYGWVDVASPVAIGEYRVVVQGVGEYSDEEREWFYIEEGNLNTGADKWDDASVYFKGVKSKFAYTGSAIDPGIAVRLSDGTALAAGTDYSIKYRIERYDEAGDEYYEEVAAPVEIGYYEAVLTPLGQYAEPRMTQKHMEFSVFDSKNIGSADAFFSDDDAFAYTGKAVYPKPLVLMDGKRLTEGTDYKLSYKKRVDGDYATVIPIEPDWYYCVVEGIGAYAGTEENPSEQYVGFSITAGLDLDDYGAATFPQGHEFTYTGKAIMPKPVVTYQGKRLTEGTDYVLSYESDNIVEAGWYSVSAIGINGYRGSVEVGYRIVHETKSFYNTTVTLPNGQTSFTYTGKPLNVKPSLVAIEDTQLKEGKDYTVAYKIDGHYVDYPMEIGEYRLYLIGQGVYEGQTASRVFRIVAANDLSAATISMKTSYDYTGKAIKPAPVVTLAGKTLVRNKDYTITYWGQENGSFVGEKQFSSLKNAGDYYVKIVPKGTKYVGTRVVHFTIDPISLADGATVTLKNDTLQYTGKNVTPTVVVKNGKKKVAASNYVVLKPAESKVPGVYSVVVRGKKNYGDEVTLNYTVAPKNTKLTKVTGGAKSFTAKWKKVAVQNSGYQLRYSTKADMAKAKTKTIKKVKTTKLTVKKLRAKTTYYVQVRTWTTASGAKVYGNWSAVKAVTTK